MSEEEPSLSREIGRGAGQVVLPPVSADLAPSDQVRTLYRLSDPALSELGLDEFLDELLVRVRESLAVDTVAILLYDEETKQLVARAAKGIEEEVERGVRIPIGVGFAGRIAAERVAVFIADVDHADILNPILREKGIRSLLGLPLIVEGALIGVMHVGSLKPRKFGERDLAVLQFAAARAGPGIERARLHSALEHEHRVAVALQRSLLPRRLQPVSGVLAAARYLPATDEVGGDWYDLFELPRGRVGIAIGDVVGHGLRAAALMGQLRTALHAYALEDCSPGRTLELVDRFIASMSEPAMATAAYAILDPESGQLVLASAGHLPPLIVGERGTRRLESQPAAPLGAVSYATFPEVTSQLAAGETLVLYTDGLIERPSVPLDESIAQLAAALAGASSPEQACRRALDNFDEPAGLRDDVAVVAVQNCAVPQTLERELAADPDVLADLRRELRRWLRAQGADDQESASITLAVNEACANAIEHAYSPAHAHFRLRASNSEGEIEIVVSDAGSWRTPRKHAGGRGLVIIDAVMDAVDVMSGERGTDVVMRKRLAA